jgi:hypothetical protein
MDTLTTEWMTAEQIAQRIAGVESAHPSLKQDNEAIKALAEAHPELAKVVDVDAAMVSSCRSDILNCGRCRFWAEARRMGCV